MSVRDFYDGSVLLVTGGAGFLGKTFVAKLLRSCPGVKTIYLLIRSKKGVDPLTRWEQLQQNELFDDVRSSLSKVVVLNGEVSQPNIGLSESDARRVIEETNIVIHCAANLDFFKNLSNSLENNVIGTKNVLDFCLQMKHIKSFLQISTAFSNFSAKKSVVNEKVYPLQMDLEELYTSYGDEKYLEQIRKTIPYYYHNPYVLSKAAAESVVESYSHKLPVAIFRPSIVTSSLKEPKPGWVDDRSAISTIAICCGTGVLRNFLGGPDVSLEITPVDIVVNSMILAASHSSVLKKEGNKLPIFNCVSSTLNPISLNQFGKMMSENWIKMPTKHVTLYPNMNCTRSYFRVFFSFLTLIWTRIIYFFLLQKTKHVSQHLFVMKILWLMYDPIAHHIKFDCENQMLLSKIISFEENNIFFTDVCAIKWHQYITNYVRGLRKYLLKEDESTICDVREKLTRVWWITKTGQILSLFSLALPIIFIFKCYY